MCSTELGCKHRDGRLGQMGRVVLRGQYQRYSLVTMQIKRVKKHLFPSAGPTTFTEQAGVCFTIYYYLKITFETKGWEGL